jgi:hypothetical protein
MRPPQKVFSAHFMLQTPMSQPLRSWFDTLTALSQITGRPIDVSLGENGDPPERRNRGAEKHMLPSS